MKKQVSIFLFSLMLVLSLTAVLSLTVIGCYAQELIRRYDMEGGVPDFTNKSFIDFTSVANQGEGNSRALGIRDSLASLNGGAFAISVNTEGYTDIKLKFWYKRENMGIFGDSMRIHWVSDYRDSSSVGLGILETEWRNVVAYTPMQVSSGQTITLDLDEECENIQDLGIKFNINDPHILSGRQSLYIDNIEVLGTRYSQNTGDEVCISNLDMESGVPSFTYTFETLLSGKLKTKDGEGVGGSSALHDGKLGEFVQFVKSINTENYTNIKLKFWFKKTTDWNWTDAFQLNWSTSYNSGDPKPLLVRDRWRLLKNKESLKNTYGSQTDGSYVEILLPKQADNKRKFSYEMQWIDLHTASKLVPHYTQVWRPFKRVWDTVQAGWDTVENPGSFFIDNIEVWGRRKAPQDFDVTPPTTGTGFAWDSFTNKADGQILRFHSLNASDSQSGIGGVKWWGSRDGIEGYWFENARNGIYWDNGQPGFDSYIDVPVRGEGTYLYRAHAYDTEGNGAGIGWSQNVDIRTVVDRQKPRSNGIQGTQYTDNTSGTIRVHDYSVRDESTVTNGASGINSVKWWSRRSADFGTTWEDWQEHAGSGYDGSTAWLDMPLRGQGKYQVHRRIYDKAGNVAEPWDGSTGWGETFVITDATPPSTGTGFAWDNFTNKADGQILRFHSLNASDNQSGIGGVKWWGLREGIEGSWFENARDGIYWDNGQPGFDSYIDVPVRGEGTYLYIAHSYDKAGNGAGVGWSQRVDIRTVVDRQKPRSNGIEGSQYTSKTSGTIRVHDYSVRDESTVTNGASGINSVKWWSRRSADFGTTWEDWQEHAGSGYDGSTAWLDMPLRGQGKYQVHRRIYDKAGNVAEPWDGSTGWGETFVIADTTPPTTGTGIAWDNFTNKADGQILRFHSLNASDNQSGIGGVKWWGLREGIEGYWFENARDGIYWDNGQPGFDSYIDVPVRGEGTYLYRAHAYDTQGNGAGIGWSQNVDIRTVVDRQKPRSNGIQGTQYTDNTSGTIRVHDYSVRDESTVTNGASGINSVKWWSRRSADFGTTWEDWQEHAGSGYDGSTAWLDMPLRGQGKYQVHRRIYDKAGNVAEPWDASTGWGETFVITDATPPSTGTGFAWDNFTNKADGQILRFHSLNASDNQSGIGGVKWWGLREGIEGYWFENARDGIYWDNGQPGFDSYIDVPVRGEGTYLYRAHAYDTQGNGAGIGWSQNVDIRTVVDRQKPRSNGIEGVQNTSNTSGTIRVHDYSVRDESTVTNGASGINNVKWWSMRSADFGKTWEAWQEHGAGEYDGSTAWFDLPLRGEGKYAIARRIYDMAGNVAEPWDGSTGWGETFIIADGTAPVLTNIVTIPEGPVNNKEYKIRVNATDAGAGIMKVCFPTWTDKNGQDDLIADWANNSVGINVSGNTWEYTVDMSQHNKEEGDYTTHVYAWDKNGNHSMMTIKVTVASIIDTFSPDTGAGDASEYYTNKADGQIIRFKSLNAIDDLSEVGGVKWWGSREGIETQWYENARDGIQWDDGQQGYDTYLDVPIRGEGTYFYRAHAYDTLGNGAGVGWSKNVDIRIVVDRQKPRSNGIQPIQYTRNTTGTIRVNDYNVSDNSTVTNGAGGVNKVKWWSRRSVDFGTTWEEWQEHGEGGYDASTAWFEIPLRGEGKYQVHRRIYDKAGNIAEPTDSSTGAGETFIISDVTPPAFTNLGTIPGGPIITGTSYKIQVNVEDNQSGISKVSFPTWTDKNGKDDLIANWSDNAVGTNLGGGVWEYTVNISDHNNETKNYTTQIYAWDKAGNELVIDSGTYVNSVPWANAKTVDINGNESTGWVVLDCGDTENDELTIVVGNSNLPGDFKTKDGLSFEFKPENNWGGTAWFDYYVKDVSGSKSDWKRVTIGGNKSPTIEEQKIEIFGSSLKIKFTATQFTSKFYDADGDDLKKIKITSLPSEGKLFVDNKEIQKYDEIMTGELDKLRFENGNFTKDASTPETFITEFKWAASDGNSYSNEVTCKINIVKMVNDIS